LVSEGVPGKYLIIKENRFDFSAKYKKLNFPFAVSRSSQSLCGWYYSIYFSGMGCAMDILLYLFSLLSPGKSRIRCNESGFFLFDDIKWTSCQNYLSV